MNNLIFITIICFYILRNINIFITVNNIFFRALYITISCFRFINFTMIWLLLICFSRAYWGRWFSSCSCSYCSFLCGNFSSPKIFFKLLIFTDSMSHFFKWTSYSYFRVKLQQRVRFYNLERSSALLDKANRIEEE